MNEGNIEAKEKIAELQQRFEAAAQEIERINTKRLEIDDAIARAISAYRDELWNIRLEFEKDDLAACLKGPRQKEAFKEKLEKTPLPTGTIRTKKELSEAAKFLSSSDAKQIPTLTFLSFTGEVLENDEILAKVITPSGDSYLADVIRKLGNSDWVRSALPYFDHSENQCPLCQQELPHDFQRDVKLLFDKSYDEEVAKVALLKDEYANAADVLELELESSTYSSSAIQSDADFIKAKGELKRLLATNRRILSDKLESVSKAVALESTKASLGRLNMAIKTQKAKDDEAQPPTEQEGSVVCASD